MLISEVLIRAKDELLTRGWCQGTYRNDAAAVCALGAIIAASCDAPSVDFGTGFVIRAEAALHRAIGLSPLRGVMQWNDEPTRTPEQVLDAFDAAIAIVQQHERAEGETTVGQTTTVLPRGSNVAQMTTG